MTEVSESAAPSERPRALLFRFVFGFFCVFAGLALPSPGLGPFYVRAHTALGNALVEGRTFQSGVALRFESTDEDLAKNPWQTLLVIEPPTRVPASKVSVDLRTLGYLPVVAFIALVAAAPVRSVRRSLGVAFLGLAILEPLLILLIVLPLLSFLGGQGPIQVFTLGPGTHVVVNVIYRALVAPLGMAYAVPLLVFWALLQIPVRAFGSGPLFTKFQQKRPRDVTSVPTQPS